ncbi:hypothetical protein RZS28_07080 [Methylocapsa polymorpha]|uniref:Uncharacterized protein n=1 Tax=Methylocapsa polymorpha TaxID=3080828 RepID=A0ABZ0HXB6_9HYPH|nr:hypothetical protein RZS28_07080 [Methylocapsa sp. RX1]
MSEPVTKRRPMIDLEEFERRLRRPRSANTWDSEPLPELAQLLGRQEGARRTGFEPKGQGAMKGNLYALTPSERKEPPPLERFITGDFAAIEAGLLGAGRQTAAGLAQAGEWPIERREPPAPERVVDFAAIEAGLVSARRQQPAKPQAEENRVERKELAAPERFISRDFSAIETELLSARPLKVEATRTEAEKPSAFVDEPKPADDESYGDESYTAASRHIGNADGEVRSRLALYAMAAIIIVGLAGIGVSLSSGGGENTAFDAADGTDALQSGPLSGSDVSANEASDFGGSQQPAAALADNSGRPADPAQEKAPRVISLGESARSDEGLATETASIPPQEQTPVQPDQLANAVPAEPAKVRTVAVRPDGALIPNNAPAPAGRQRLRSQLRRTVQLLPLRLRQRNRLPTLRLRRNRLARLRPAHAAIRGQT